ncbi:uncharacterized protein VSU04_011180 [Chlamydotis macqueenii]
MRVFCALKPGFSKVQCSLQPQRVLEAGGWLWGCGTVPRWTPGPVQLPPACTVSKRAQEGTSPQERGGIVPRPGRRACGHRTRPGGNGASFWAGWVLLAVPVYKGRSRRLCREAVGSCAAAVKGSRQLKHEEHRLRGEKNKQPVHGEVLGPEMLPFWCLVLLGGLLPCSQGLLNLGSVLGLSPAQSKDGLLGNGLPSSEGLLSKKGGLLGTGLLGEGGLLGTGLLGRGSPSGEESRGPLDGGNEIGGSGGLGTGLLGGEPGSSGLLGTGILGGEGLRNGLLSNGLVGNGLIGNGLLGNGFGNGLVGNGLLSNGLGNGLLGNNSLLGEKGLLGTGLLGKGGLLGNGSLLGLDGLVGGGGLLGGGLLGGVPQKSMHFAWLKALNLENIRVSWKVLRGGELVLNLYSKLVLRLPGIFHFLSGSSVETNITSHIALTQDSPGDLKLVIKDCSNLLVDFSVNLRKGFLANVVSGLLNSSLRSLVPALLCPLVNIWFSIINMKLQFLNRVISFGLLGKIYSALSNLPVTSGQFVELDLQNSPFPSAFIDWLLQTAGANPGSSQ